MKKALYPVCLTLFLCLPGCVQQESQSATSTTQEPVLVPHGEGWQEYKSGLDALISKRETVRQKYEELERLRAPVPGEPVLSDQKSLKEEEIVTACAEIETGAQSLLDQTYLRDHKGETADAQSLIDFAREFRQKAQTGS